MSSAKPNDEPDYESSEENQVESTAGARKEWTIMLYLAGDNNLSEDMIRAINEMSRQIETTGDQLKQAGQIDIKNGVGLLVEFDAEHPIVPTRRYDLTYDPLIPYSTSSSPIKIPDPVESIPRAPSIPDSDSEDSIERRIEAFICDSVKKQPAHNYFLILSGHADSFQGRTLLLDENPSGAATIKGISEMLKRVTSKVLHDKLKVLAWDGCVMNSLEVIYQFRDVTEAWIGSQGSIPNYTWDYREIMQALLNVPRRDLTRDKIIDVVLDSVQRYNFGFAFGGRSMDLSYCEMGNIKEIARMLNYIARSFISLLGYYIPQLGTVPGPLKPAPGSLISKHIARLLLLAHWNCQPYMRNQSIDLVDFSERIAQECENSFMEILNNCNVSDEFFGDQANPLEVNIAEKLNESDCLSEGARTLLLILGMLFFLFDNLAKTLSETFRGISTGADFRFSNGVSVFLPWSFLAYRMTSKEYQDLDFSKDYKMWRVFIALYVKLTARPPQTIDIKDILEEKLQGQFQDIFTFMIFVTANLFNQSLLTAEGADPAKKEPAEIEPTEDQPPGDVNLTGMDAIDALAEPIMEKLLSIPGTKDNPNRTRGLEYYLYHFEKTNNIFPELEVKKSFRKVIGEPSGEETEGE